MHTVVGEFITPKTSTEPTPQAQPLLFQREITLPPGIVFLGHDILRERSCLVLVVLPPPGRLQTLTLLWYGF